MSAAPRPAAGGPALPPGLLVAWHGDDFSGSADVLEALGLGGIPAVLFLEPPTAADLARHPGVRAVGVAGLTRSLPVESLEAALAPALRALAALRPRLLHYKVCSTFDSSPDVGSIGRAMEIGRAIAPGGFLPILAGAPALGRYGLFGNLFARSGPESEVFRLDRHPTMAHHPVTPMDEADLRLVLARQTRISVGLLDALELRGGDEAIERSLDALLERGCEAVLLDVLDRAHLEAIGRLLLRRSGRGQPLFAVGSSGIEHALVEAWRAAGALAPPSAPPRIEPVDRLLVVSGSCSPVTAGQIDAALEGGFEDVALDAARLADAAGEPGERARAVERAARALARGRSAVVHTARGPGDPRVLRAASGAVEPERARRLGEALGRIVEEVLLATGVRRVVVAGGDTSGRAIRRLGLRALELRAPAAPGSPLLRARADGAADGLEVLLKGGQVGTRDLFLRLLRGAASCTPPGSIAIEPGSRAGVIEPGSRAGAIE